MGNSHCVPQAPRRLRASFSRKPSLKGNREDGARMPAGLLGPEAARSGDAAANKLFHYIPGATPLGEERTLTAPPWGAHPAESLSGERNRDAGLSQSGARWAGRAAGGASRDLLPQGTGARVSVAAVGLGVVLVVPLDSKEPQDILDLENQRENLEQPFLSVFKKARRRVPVRNLGKVVHYAKVQLRFQHSQDVSDCYLELFPAHLYFQAHGSEGLTFQGLLPLTELSVCLLEGSREHAFQITGPLPAPLLVLCPSRAELDRWLYHLEKQTALLGGLQHCHSAPPQGSCGDELPWTLQRRLTRLQTASGHEPGGSAVCASRVKLQHLPAQEQWDRLLVLYPTSLAIFSEELDGLCFKGELPLRAVHINLEEKEKQIHSFLIEGPLINTIRVVCASYEDYSHWLLCLRAVTHREGAPPLPGAKSFPGLQVTGSGRGSLSSGGRTSWDSGCLVPPSTRTSHSLPESSVPSTVGCSSQHTPDQANSDRTSVGRRRTELRRSSSRSPRSKARAEGRGPATPLHLDLTQLNRLSLENSPDAPDHASETSHSPLYADPYTPPATSHRRVTDVRGLEEFLSAMQSSPGPVPLSPLPLVPVSVPASDPGSSSSGPTGPHLLSKKGVLQSRASQRQRGSAKDGEPQPPDSPQLVSSAREGLPEPQLPLTDGWSSRRSQGPGYDHLWDETLSSSHRKCPQLGGPEASAGLVQWI
ncbi:pleckstrin homology domain-containing family N member 1 isoform X1 [Rhinopithecus roxellana]|uniref:pleckstrin homology domain-containing family N member 1 isoform X1 n=1 Tax=Rhinopithecus roxellana TaxID=61622 RepID=UPI001237649B|nr:pleckstrin homology domain-containing family N member 1 isoform X1 [Rhinopithecus roxellana]XP_030798273.1 pleckstrin homology domain-containing family N member 1 isoform X1 [Rhinopithecus roxellana]